MKKIPILKINNFLFPECDIDLSLDNSNLKELIFQSQKNYNRKILIIPYVSKNSKKKKNLLGTLAEIILTDSKKVRLSGLDRVKVNNLENQKKITIADYQIIEEKKLDNKSINKITEKFINILPDLLQKLEIIPLTKNNLPFTLMKGNPARIVDYISQNSQVISSEIKLKILSFNDLSKRLQLLIEASVKNDKDSRIDREINDKLEDDNRKEQRLDFLRRKKFEIDKELGGKSNDREIEKFLKRLEKRYYPDYVRDVIEEELERIENLPSNSSESGIIRQYVDWLTIIPWRNEKKDKKEEEDYDLLEIEKKLNEKHFGLKEVKESIIEYLASEKKANKKLGKVICFIGPPGVGKTSSASSIAKALNRKFASFSLSGIDEYEIKGHRRTYIGALPGKIIQSMKAVGESNPVIFIDEIDKSSNRGNYRGDAANALLDLLDPETSNSFKDSYIEIPYDMSEVMIICAANSTDIPKPLKDRMKVIYIRSYTIYEKLTIAEKYIIPEIKSKLNFENIIFDKNSIIKIIEKYTTESGVRELGRKIEDIFSKIIVEFFKKKIKIKNIIIREEDIKKYLGKEKYEGFIKREDSVGIINGLAWTEYGGDVLVIEAINYLYTDSKKVELTGNLGDIMKESANIALSYIKSNCETFGIDREIFSKNTIHIHALEGAVPKEGPSAGIALTSVIISSLIDKKISSKIGMTGEISLNGEVLAIGGIVEKAVAAERNGLETIIVPKANEKDIDDIPEETRKKVKIIFVKKYIEVWKLIFDN